MAVHANSHLRDTHGAPSQACGQCLSFAPLQNMAGGGATVIVPATLSHDHVLATRATSVAMHGTRASFQARAPPASS